MRTTLLRLALALPLAGPLVAQDDVLAVEQRQDVRARDALARSLRALRCTFAVEAMTPKDCCRLLTTLTGDKVNFLFAAKGDAAAAPPFSLELKAASLWSVMSAVQQLTGLRFVYRDGIVFLLGKEQLRPLTWVQVYDLRGAVTPLRSFPGPKLGLPGNDGDEVLFPPEQESGTTISGYTAEALEELIKAQVTPELWGTDQVSIRSSGGMFVIRHTPAGHRQIAALLVELGVVAPPRTLLRR